MFSENLNDVYNKMSLYQTFVSFIKSSNCLCKDRQRSQKHSEASLSLGGDNPLGSTSEGSIVIHVPKPLKKKHMQTIRNQDLDSGNLTELLTLDFTTYSNEDEARSLFSAIEKNDTGLMMSKISNSNLNTFIDSEGCSLLHRAVFAGNLNTIGLIAQKVNLDAADDSGRTALHYACLQNKSEIAELLIQRGCDVTICDKYGKTAAEYAETKNLFLSFGNSRNGEDDVEIVKTEGSHMEVMIKELKKQKLIKKKEKYDRLVESPKTDMQNYRILKLIARSNFSKVFLVEDIRNSNLYALKVMKKSVILDRKVLEYIKLEKKILSELKHPFIVPLVSSFQSKNYLMLLMHYCPKNLSEEIQASQGLPLPLIRLYASQIILVLEHLHYNQIIYRDLKPSNLLIDKSGHILFADFGLCKHCDNLNTSTFCGSFGYLAPEVSNHKGYGKDIDWYMLGLVIYEMATGKPFYDKSEEGTEHEILDDLIKRLTEESVEARLGYRGDADEVKRHPFFSEVQWENMLRRRSVLGNTGKEERKENFERSLTPNSNEDSLSSISFIYD